jgi:hypothetical protein
MRDNIVRAKLKRGEPVIGTMVTDFSSPAIALLLADAGFDFFFIDMEHGVYDLETVATIIRVARLANIVPLVRVPDAEYHLIARALDAGAKPWSGQSQHCVIRRSANAAVRRGAATTTISTRRRGSTPVTRTTTSSR